MSSCPNMLSRFFSGRALLTSPGIHHISRVTRQIRDDYVKILGHRRNGYRRGDKMWCYVKCCNALTNEDYETYMWIHRKYLIPPPPSFQPPPESIYYYDNIYMQLQGQYNVVSSMRHAEEDSYYLWLELEQGMVGEHWTKGQRIMVRYYDEDDNNDNKMSKDYVRVPMPQWDNWTESSNDSWSESDIGIQNTNETYENSVNNDDDLPALETFSDIKSLQDWY
jgi:hypothetical protein